MNSEGSRWITLLPVVLATLLYAVLFGVEQTDNADLETTVLIVLLAPVRYLLAMYLYFAVTRLAFARQLWGVWFLAVAALVVSIVISGGSHLWMLITGWSMVAVTAVLTGRLTSFGHRPRTVYIAAVISLVVFGTAQYLAVWMEMIRMAPDNVQSLVDEANRQLATVGENKQRSREIAEAFRAFVTVVFRLVPAIMLLAAVMQFTVGYLLFARWIGRFSVVPDRFDPFHFWKMPYGCIPVVAAVALIRLLGNEPMRIAADNALAFLAVFYAVTGLSLMEYYLRKIQFTTFMKVLLYVFLALLPLVYPLFGMVTGGAIMLLGFADSFADWRRVRLRELG